MIYNAELRERARRNLGNSIFHTDWLVGLAICLVSSIIANAIPLLAIFLIGPLSFGICLAYLKKARGAAKIDFNDLFAGFELFGSRSDFIVHDSIGRNELHFLSEELAESFCDRSEAHLRHRLSLRSAEVRHENSSSTVIHKILYGRKSSPDTCIICDFACLKRYIEIATNKNTTALYVDVINCLFV